MANHGCINGSLDGVNYSSPVPIIGLYIAAGSLACMLLMIYDVVVAGILARKRWLPCKYFELNSVTLTLLAIATKLPVDLTTPMPERQDQLSKLTGTAIICVSMGFLAPSLGINGESECFTNMIALSIFVVTVAVNICIQLRTGVIVLFYVEHIIMLSLMLILLLMLWHMCFYIKTEKRIDSDRYSNLLSKGSNSMFERLKLCSLYAYCSNPQFKISMYPMSAALSTICLGCFVIIVEATFRSLILKQVHFCQGASDYGWSMPYIVVTQIVTIVVGTIAIVVRWVSLFTRMDLESIFVPFLPDDDHVIQMNKTLRAKGITMRMLQNFVTFTITRIVLIAQVVIVSPSLLVRNLLRIKKEDNKLEYFGEDLVAASGYIVRKSLDDMIRLKDQFSSSRSLYHPSRILCLKSPSPHLHLDSMKIKDGIHHIEVTSLSMALLVKVAQASIPSHLLESLLNVFYEAREVVHFIDRIIQPKSSEMNDKLAYARAVWIGGNFTCLLSGHAQPSLDHIAAVDTIGKLKETLHSGDIWYDLGVIINFINRRRYSSIVDLYTSVEQVFVDMLHALYAQLPNAIYKSLRETPVEEFEENVRAAMKFLFKIGSLECQTNWLFPSGMSSVVSDDDYPRELTGQLKRLREVVLVRRGPDFEIIDEAHIP